MPRKPGPAGSFGRRLGNVAHEHADGKDPHPRWIDTDAPDDSDQGRFHLPVYNPAEHTVPVVISTSRDRGPLRTLFYGAVAAGATFAAISALLHSLTRRN